MALAAWDPARVLQETGAGDSESVVLMVKGGIHGGKEALSQAEGDLEAGEMNHTLLVGTPLPSLVLWVSPVHPGVIPDPQACWVWPHKHKERKMVSVPQSLDSQSRALSLVLQRLLPAMEATPIIDFLCPLSQAGIQFKQPDAGWWQ